MGARRPAKLCPQEGGWPVPAGRACRRPHSSQAPAPSRQPPFFQASPRPRAPLQAPCCPHVTEETPRTRERVQKAPICPEDSPPLLCPEPDPEKPVCGSLTFGLSFSLISGRTQGGQRSGDSSSGPSLGAALRFAEPTPPRTHHFSPAGTALVQPRRLPASRLVCTDLPATTLQIIH